MSQSANRLLVSVDTTGEPVLVGTLNVNSALRRRTGISTTFTYDPTWLARPDAYAIDPQLSLFGRSSTVAGLPGCLPSWSARSGFQTATPPTTGLPLPSSATSCTKQSLTPKARTPGTSIAKRMGTSRNAGYLLDYCLRSQGRALYSAER